jgi:soluble lytic murein transglycosylase
MKNKFLFFMLLLVSTLANAKDAFRSVASIKQNLRIGHAKELLGKRYRKSVVSHFENQEGLEKNLLEIVTKSLPKNYKNKAAVVSNTIIKEAGKYKLDPYFLMAVISGESSFNPEAKGPVGEIGLMQLRPSTGEWIAKMIDAKWDGEKTLKDPVANIKLGAAYINWLRNKTDNKSQLYLAAYNMGLKSVKKAVKKNIYPKDYPIHVMKRYLAFYKSI